LIKQTVLNSILTGSFRSRAGMIFVCSLKQTLAAAAKKRRIIEYIRLEVVLCIYMNSFGWWGNSDPILVGLISFGKQAAEERKTWF